MKKNLAILATAAAVITVSIGTTFAQSDKGPFHAEITARKSVMQVAKFNIGILGAMAKGKRDYDAQLAANSAYNLHLAALMQNGAMWPKGSDTSNAALKIKTTAKPEIWDNFPQVGKHHKAWTESSEKLSKVAGNGLDALRGAIGPVGKSCKGCHDDFRQKAK